MSEIPRAIDKYLECYRKTLSPEEIKKQNDFSLMTGNGREG